MWRISHYLYHSASEDGEASAGLFFWVQKGFIDQQSITVDSGRSLEVGRARWCSRAQGSPACIVALHSERFDACMVGCIAAARERLGLIVSAAQPLPGLAFLRRLQLHAVARATLEVWSWRRRGRGTLRR